VIACVFIATRPAAGEAGQGSGAEPGAPVAKASVAAADNEALQASVPAFLACSNWVSNAESQNDLVRWERRCC